jgi:hypothetical protein
MFTIVPRLLPGYFVTAIVNEKILGHGKPYTYPILLSNSIKNNATRGGAFTSDAPET